MKYCKYIFVFLVLTSTSSFSQTTFTNLDSLLTKHYNALNKRDSIYYLTLVNQPVVFENAKTNADSSIILKSYMEAFNNVLEEIEEMAMKSDFTMAYSSYELKSKNNSKEGKLMVHVNLIINDSFMIKMPLLINKEKEQYSIESPMLVMVVDNKE